ncbi:hypothetical protein [Emticicia sp. 17c]|uniref:hypothetical protein n=1 Tax=Emticicia sp. 17c TaxID=3127704 RepID=UPI00301D8997
MKKLPVAILCLLAFNGAIAQTKKFTVSLLPAINKEINGIAVGLAVNSSHDVKFSRINGLCIELPGIGIILPLVPSDPIFEEKDEFYLDPIKLDSAIKAFDKSVYKIHGVVVSPGGIAGHDVSVSGVNLSGANTFTAKLNGFSIAILLNLNGVVNGVSIGVLNETMQTRGIQLGVFSVSKKIRGLQMGLFTKTLKLKGIQIGLWNINEKRKFPFFNWNFN